MFFRVFALSGEWRLKDKKILRNPAHPVLGKPADLAILFRKRFFFSRSSPTLHTVYVAGQVIPKLHWYQSMNQTLLTDTIYRPSTTHSRLLQATATSSFQQPDKRLAGKTL